MLKRMLILALTATVTVASGGVLAQANKKPVAKADTATTAAGTAVTINVLANDSDPNNDPISLQSVTNGTNGTAVKSGSAAVYTPKAGFSGSDSFTYKVVDSKGASSTGTVTVTVTAPVNTPPVANADSASTQAPNSVTIDLLANDTDANGDTLTVTSNTQGGLDMGTVTRSGGIATYTPSSGFSGTDSFNYTISDGKGGTATAKVTVTVAPPPNAAPVANADSASTFEITPVTINLTANDTDADGDTLSVTSVGTAANGAVNREGNSVTYSPKGGFVGTDSFTYIVVDSKGGSANSSATITVAPAPNQPPVANADTLTVQAGLSGSVDVLANDTDADGDTIIVTVSTQGANGSVSGSGGTLTYTPQAGFSGSDSFGYSISDGEGGTASTTVAVTVSAKPNTPPVAAGDSLSTATGSAGSVNLLANDTDADGDTLSISGNTQGANGSVTVAGGVATYTPNSGFSGSDSFGYTVSDGNGGSASGTVAVNVAAAVAANNPPTANGDTLSTTAGVAGSVNLLANDADADGDTLTVSGTSQGTSGTVSVTGGIATYTPNSGFSGTDAFSYSITDGKGGSASGTVAVSVAAAVANRPPVANPDQASAAPGGSVSVSVLANDTDPDGDALKINSNTQGAMGTVTKSGNNLVYLASAAASGTDTFTYKVGDGKGFSVQGTVTITIGTGAAATNAAPVATADSITTAAGKAASLNVIANDTDPNGDALTVTGNTPATNGTVSISAGTATYTPKAGFSGTDSFTYTISDGKGGSATGTVSVTVTAAANALPQAVADAISTEAGKAGSVNLLANDTDADGDPLSVSANTQGANGSVAIAGGVATYTPKAGFTGNDSFTYTLSDGKGGSATGTVSVTVATAAAATGTTTGTAVLSWSVPTTRANGSPLPTSEIAGYEIYVLGQNSGTSNVIEVNDPLATTYTVEGLAADTYSFSMVAKDTTGNLSEMSAVVEKVIQ